MGNRPIWLFDTGWQLALDSPGAQASLAHLPALLAGRAWWTMVPDTNHTVLTAGVGTGADEAATARASNGSFVLAYLPSARAVTINMAQLSGPNVVARWYDPTNGDLHACRRLALRGERVQQSSHRPERTATGTTMTGCWCWSPRPNPGGSQLHIAQVLLHCHGRRVMGHRPKSTPRPSLHPEHAASEHSRRKAVTQSHGATASHARHVRRAASDRRSSTHVEWWPDDDLQTQAVASTRLHEGCAMARCIHRRARVVRGAHRHPH